jgi:RNA polymerase sigma factor (TIGR02999 family)
MLTEPPITQFLSRTREGSSEAQAELIRVLYDEFRARARRKLYGERPGHSLAASDLTNVALLKLMQNDEFSKAANRHQLYWAFARCLRQILIDHARKRRPKHEFFELDELAAEVRRHTEVDLETINDGLAALAQEHGLAAQVLEMRYFGGYQIQEIADAVNMHVRRIERAAQFGRAWLRIFFSSKGTL